VGPFGLSGQLGGDIMTEPLLANSHAASPSRQAHRLRRQEDAVETRGALLQAARKVFAAQGYVDASLVELARAAQLTTGALYHHFDGKAELFREVAEGVARELCESARQAADAEGTDPVARLDAAVAGVLTAAVRPENYRIAFADGRVLLGSVVVRELERAHAYGFLLELVSELARTDVLRASAELVTSALWGTLTESAANIVAAEHAEQALNEGLSVLGLVLEAFIRHPHRSRLAKQRISVAG
jgi:AcrR family transcriptional regulator